MKKRTGMILVLIYLIAGLVACSPKKKEQIVNHAPPGASDPCQQQQLSYESTSYVCVTDPSAATSDPFENSPKIYTVQLTPDSTPFRDFLKEAMGICDRQAGQLAGIDFGSYDCNAFMAGKTTFTIYVPSPSSATANVTISSYYQQTGSFNVNVSFGLTLAPWAYQNPMALPNLSVAPINNNEGFEIYGPATNPAFQAYSLAWNKRLRIRVESGKLTDSIVRADIYFGNDLMSQNVPFQLQDIGF